MLRTLQKLSVSGSLVYYGDDPSFRTRVLEHAGYKVRRCSSPAGLADACASPLDAVLTAALDESVTEQVIDVTWSRSSAPLVRFERPGVRQDRFSVHFDLSIPTATSPYVWLRELAVLIGETRFLCTESQVLRERAIELREESAELRRGIRRERLERARRGVLKQFPDPL